MGADFGDIVGAGLVQFGLPYCMYRRGRRVNERKFRATENAVLNSLLSPFLRPVRRKICLMIYFPVRWFEADADAGNCHSHVLSTVSFAAASRGHGASIDLCC